MEKHSDIYDRDKAQKRAQEYKSHRGRARHLKNEPPQRGVQSTPSFHITLGPKR